MDVSEKMKYKLANAMKELLVHTPVDKITVKQIVDQCDVTRPTFYRHFKDKYDLINWYFDVLAQMSFKQMGISLTLREGLLKKFEFIKGEGQFFAAAFSSESQNCLILPRFNCHDCRMGDNRNEDVAGTTRRSADRCDASKAI